MPPQSSSAFASISAVQPHEIALRDLEKSDLPMILDYWFRSPRGYISSMGVDWNKMPSESQMRKNLRHKLSANRRLSSSKLNALVILFKGRPVGFHTLTSIQEGATGIFHAHICKPEMRGRGIGLQSYPQACRIFMERFQLQKIEFKTPLQNTGAIRVKEKLGIRSTGEIVIGFDMLKTGTRGRAFELTREECAQIQIDAAIPSTPTLVPAPNFSLLLAK